MKLDKGVIYHILILNKIVTKIIFKGTARISKGSTTIQLTIKIEATRADLMNQKLSYYITTSNIIPHKRRPYLNGDQISS